jgi:hypothetical protein
MNEDELKETVSLISTGMGLELSTPLISHEQLRDWLAEKIKGFMQNDFHRLLSILYRIDVHENNVKRVFDEYRPDEIPFMIAELIIQRQLQKAKTRIAYRNRNNRIE